MNRLIKYAFVTTVVATLFFVGNVNQADAQVAVTTYYPSTPVVGYVPVRYGLFGWRRAYRPVVGYPAPVTVTNYYTPPVTTYYPPAVPVTSYYVTQPVRTYYVAPPAPVTTYYPGTVIIGR